MEGGSYLHFNITNIVTIWIMAIIGFSLSGLLFSAWKKKSNS